MIIAGVVLVVLVLLVVVMPVALPQTEAWELQVLVIKDSDSS